MSKRLKFANVCAFKLFETYETLFELHHKLGISDEYLLNTTREDNIDNDISSSLHKLLESYKTTRDDLITWYLKQTLVELNVTISLLTAKIKFIEYKLRICDGLDLHQACSLSLVNFCNILADMTVLNVNPSERKTMHTVSNEVDIPVWLSHYRNQICHVPSESPCIAILVPLVVKSLSYMKDSFWSKIFKRDVFDAQQSKNLIRYVCSPNKYSLVEQQVSSRKIALRGKRAEKAQAESLKRSKAHLLLMKTLTQNADQVMKIIWDFILQDRAQSQSRNYGVLIKLVILSRCFEKFVLKLLTIAEEFPKDKNVIFWLHRVITLIGMRKKENLQRSLEKLDIAASPKVIKLIDVPPIKCCQIAGQLIRVSHSIIRKLLMRLRYKLLPILGKRRTLLLIKITNIAKRTNTK